MMPSTRLLTSLAAWLYDLEARLVQVDRHEEPHGPESYEADPLAHDVSIS